MYVCVCVCVIVCVRQTLSPYLYSKDAIPFSALLSVTITLSVSIFIFFPFWRPLSSLIRSPLLPNLTLLSLNFLPSLTHFPYLTFPFTHSLIHSWTQIAAHGTIASSTCTHQRYYSYSYRQVFIIINTTFFFSFLLFISFTEHLSRLKEFFFGITASQLFFILLFHFTLTTWPCLFFETRHSNNVIILYNLLSCH